MPLPPQRAGTPVTGSRRHGLAAARSPDASGAGADRQQGDGRTSPWLRPPTLMPTPSWAQSTAALALDVTQLLIEWSAGDRSAGEQLLAAVYAELHGPAHDFRRHAGTVVESGHGLRAL